MKSEIHLMFPTAVGSFECDRHDEFKKIFLERMPYHCAKHENGGLYSGENSGHIYVHTDIELHGLFKFISEGVKSYLEMLDYDHSRVDVNIIKTWISATDSNTVIPVHAHATSHLSFVYYMQMPENADVISFQVQRNPNEPYYGAFDAGTPRQKPMVNGYNSLNSNQSSLATKEGELIVFPSTLFHGTTKVSEPNKDQRIALAGDVLLVFNETKPNYATGLFDPKTWRCFN